MILNSQQEEAANAIDGVWVAIASPGSGKTTVLVERYTRMLLKGINNRDILNLTFTSAAADQMSSRVGLTDAKSVFRTFHSFALEILKAEREHLPFELCDEIIPVKAQDYRLLDDMVKAFPQVKYKTLLENIDKWKSENVEPEEAIEQTRHNGIERFYAEAYREYEIRQRQDGWLDFDNCIRETIILFESRPEVCARWKRKYISVDECQDTDEKQFQLLQLIFDGNIFAVGDENQCQPPGTMVSILRCPRQGRKAARVDSIPIEFLVPGDRLISWDKKFKRIRIADGRRYKKVSRIFDGNLLEVHSNGHKTRLTPSHYVWTKFDQEELKLKRTNYFVYLMWKSDLGYRIGTSRFRRVCGANQVSHRGYQEKAEKMWILSVTESQSEAETLEEIYSLKYGIPECVFHNGYKNSKKTEQQIQRVFNAANPSGGPRCLEDFGLLFDRPFISWPGEQHQTKFHGYFKTVAANLIPNLMSLPTQAIYKSAKIDKIKKVRYCGLVYSLEVEKDHTYIADGIPVGNCIYEWRSAQAGNLSKFNEKFPGAKTLYLGQNYRSTQKLVQFFREILPVDNGIATHMMAQNEEGLEPVIIQYEDDMQEADRVLSKIQEPEKTAILARTNRQLFIFQKLCIRRNIKHKFKDSFWNQAEVKRLMKIAKDSKDIRPANLVLEDLIREHNLIWIYRNTGDPQNDPAKNLNDVVKLAANRGTVKEFQNFLHRLTYATKNAKLLTLSTVHQAKGREYDNVYLIGCNQGKMPHKEGEIGEERRIFFVACSRAAKHLEISFNDRRSEFLNNYQDRIEVYSGLE